MRFTPMATPQTAIGFYFSFIVFSYEFLNIFCSNEPMCVADPFGPNSAAGHWLRRHVDSLPVLFCSSGPGSLDPPYLLTRQHNPKLGGFLPGIGYGGGFFRPILGSLHRPIRKYMFCSFVSAC